MAPECGTEVCDGEDNDCDGTVDEAPACQDADLIGSSRLDGATDVSVTSDGTRIYVAGHTRGDFPGVGSAGGLGRRAWLMARTPAGQQRWIQTESGAYMAVDADPYGGATAAGFMEQARGTSQKLFVTHRDAYGMQTWRTVLATTPVGAADVSAVEVGATTGASFVCGASEGEIQGESPTSPADLFVARLEDDGEIAWVEMMHFDEDRPVSCEGLSVRNGEVWVTGYLKAARGVDGTRIPVDDSPTRGPKGAPVRITVFVDLAGRHSANLADTLKKLRQTYSERVRLVFKHFPLGFHTNARPAARAAMAAREQDKFWEMYHKILDSQEEFREGQMKSVAAGWAGGRHPSKISYSASTRRILPTSRRSRLSTGTPTAVVVTGLRP